MGHTSRQQLRLLYHPIPAGASIRQRLTEQAAGKTRRLLARPRSSTVLSVRGEPFDTPTIRLQPGLAVGPVECPGE
jgi:hypothetical protein